MRTASRFIVVLTIGLAAACSSDKSTGDSGNNDNKSPDAGGGDGGGGSGGGGGGDVVKPTILEDGGPSCPAETPILDFDHCIAQDVAVGLCKTRSVASVPGTKVDDVTCGAGCTCANCTETMIACGNDPDKYCPTVIACANAKNCTGIDCYQPATCKDVIDAAPGGISGIAVALAGDVGNCVKPPMGAQVCNPTCP
jgi:hypothetical protein